MLLGVWKKSIHFSSVTKFVWFSKLVVVKVCIKIGKNMTKNKTNFFEIPAEFIHLQDNITGNFKNVFYHSILLCYLFLYIPWSYSKEFKIITCEKIIIQIILPLSALSSCCVKNNSSKNLQMVNKMQIFEKGRRLFLKYAVKNMKIHSSTS